MYFKRISDLHPLDTQAVDNKLIYYDPSTLWVEVSQSYNISGDTWTPVSSSPSYPNGMYDENGNRKPPENYENFENTHAFLSRRCNLNELFNNINNIAVNTADISFITSYYIQGKGPDQTIYINMPSANNITNVTALSDDAIVKINNTGVTAQNLTVPGEATLTAAAAYWADLAELYAADKEYEPGTLVKFGGDEEITIADTEVNAVVTEKPAYLMNTALKNQTTYPIGIVLTGRSKVRVLGPIEKFDKLCLSKDTPGVAEKRQSLDDPPIGIALEDNLTVGENLIEAVLKLTL